MRSLRVIAVAVLVLGLVVGCSDDAEPKAKPPATPSASKSASPSATPTAKPPTVPASASQRTDRAAIDFARYFIDVLNYTSISGQVERLDGIVADACESCQNIVDVTRKTYSDGGYMRGGRWTVESHAIFRPDRRPARIITLEVRTAEQQFRPASNKPEQRIEPGDEVVNVYLQPSGQSWVVTRMDVVK